MENVNLESPEAIQTVADLNAKLKAARRALKEALDNSGKTTKAHASQLAREARHEILELYKQRDVLLGLRETLNGPRIKGAMKPKIANFVRALRPVAATAPTAIAASAVGAATIETQPVGKKPVHAGSSMRDSILALLSAAPGVAWTTAELTKKLGLSKKFLDTVKTTLGQLYKDKVIKAHGRGG